MSKNKDFERQRMDIYRAELVERMSRAVPKNEVIEVFPGLFMARSSTITQQILKKIFAPKRKFPRQKNHRRSQQSPRITANQPNDEQDQKRSRLTEISGVDVILQSEKHAEQRPAEKARNYDLPLTRDKFHSTKN